MDFHDVMHAIVRIFEVLGVAILALGTAAAFVKAFRAANRRDGTDIGQGLRRDIGRAILLGLEILIVADVILTVTVDQTLENAVVLGIIVLIRSFLSASIEIEVYGSLPWRRRSSEERLPDAP
jgi:uncharacterized membrane protein